MKKINECLQANVEVKKSKQKVLNHVEGSSKGNKEEKDFFYEKTYVSVNPGEEEEYLTNFFISLEEFTNPFYRLNSLKKTVTSVLVEKGMKEATFQYGNRVYIDMSKLGFTTGRGKKRKLHSLKMMSNLQLSMQWRRFKASEDSDKKNILAVYLFNPIVHESIIYECEAEEMHYKLVLPIFKSWENHRVHVWAFWYQVCADEIQSNSKSQYVGEITILKK